MLTTSGIVPAIDAEFFHSAKESSAVEAHARGSSTCTAHLPIR
jgi:hypothetical protein